MILASGASARVDLDGATVSGDKLQTLSGGVIETVGDNKLLSRGTITSGSLIKINDGTELRLAGLIANSGTISPASIQVVFHLELSRRPPTYHPDRNRSNSRLAPEAVAPSKPCRQPGWQML